MNIKQFKKRSGLSLLELLAVIGILGILAAILLPMIGRGRGAGEASRRTHCLNNLRQIALATLNYESANMKFPSATGIEKFRGVGSADQYSPLVAILPFIEQGDLYQAIVKGNSFEGVRLEPCPPIYDDAPHWQRGNWNYLCPSVENPDDGCVPTHYGFCIGDRARNIANPKSIRGGFANSEGIGFADIADGSSNTILAGEICSTRGEAQNPFVIEQGEEFLDEPEKCLDLTTGKRGDRIFNSDVLLSPIGRGGHWADGRAGVSMFNTILAPNSPSVAVGGEVGVDGIYSASGPHPGGVVVVLLDGSTHFIDMDIDAGDPTHPAPTVEEMTNFEPSPYGVWGALGTITGGEIVEFDF